jgi:hypothetical protein
VRSLTARAEKTIYFHGAGSGIADACLWMTGKQIDKCIAQEARGSRSLCS